MSRSAFDHGFLSSRVPRRESLVSMKDRKAVRLLNARLKALRFEEKGDIMCLLN